MAILIVSCFLKCTEVKLNCVDDMDSFKLYVKV